MFVILAPISHAMLSPHSWYATAHCACPHRDGRLSWPGWLVTYQDGLPGTVTHSRAGCGVTLFETNALTLNQSSTCTHIFSCSLQFNGPVSLALEWTPEDDRKRLERPKSLRGHGKIQWKKIWKRWVWTAVTQKRLPAIVPDGDNSSSDAPLGTAV